MGAQVEPALNHVSCCAIRLLKLIRLYSSSTKRLASCRVLDPLAPCQKLQILFESGLDDVVQLDAKDPIAVQFSRPAYGQSAPVI